MGSRIPPERAAMLRELPLFAAFSDKDMARVDQRLTDVEVPAGEVLTKEGSVGREAFIIVSGEARVEIRGNTVATLGSGECFGEMALLDLEGRTATVTAETPMHLLAMSPSDFAALLEEPRISVGVLEAVVRRLRSLEG